VPILEASRVGNTGHRDGQRTVFGEVAELYDAVRPGYTGAVVDEVLAYAALGDRPAVEIGAGTGKASVPFAARGLQLVCVEPDPRMSAVLSRNTAAYARVRVEVSTFEHWRPPEPFGLLYAAACWHWLDPARRWDLVHAALVPGGTFAVLGNPHGLHDRELSAELAEIDARAGIAQSVHQAWDFTGDTPDGPYWPEKECRADGRFGDLRSIRLRWQQHYPAARYLDYLTSFSAYRILPAGTRERALSEIAAVVEARGGVEVERLNDVFLARTR
jgi:SAM-dependent methyltransferase